MTRMSLDPVITRDSTSRPSWSVPNQCAADGPALADSRFWASGLSGAMEPPAIAQITQNKTMAAPTRKVGLRTRSRHRGVAVAGAAATVTPCVIVILRLPRSRWGSRGSRCPVSNGGGAQAWAERDEQKVCGERRQGVDDADGEHPGLEHGEVLRL